MTKTESFELGQRYIGCGRTSGKLKIDKTPGNALGAYLDGAEIEVHCNAQDATGDTMNDGEITVFGNAGDATGYAMRGGSIYIEKNTGYRCGIHMKEYEEKVPVIVIGGNCGSFLGEYQAGGVIVVLGIGVEGKSPVGNFCGTGMHGGKIFLRTEHLPKDLPKQVTAKRAERSELKEIAPYIKKYSKKFGADEKAISDSEFYILTANTKNPYKQLYVPN